MVVWPRNPEGPQKVREVIQGIQMNSLEVARALGSHKSWDTKGRDCPENRYKARGSDRVPQRSEEATQAGWVQTPSG